VSLIWGLMASLSHSSPPPFSHSPPRCCFLRSIQYSPRRGLAHGCVSLRGERRSASEEKSPPPYAWRELFFLSGNEKCEGIKGGSSERERELRPRSRSVAPLLFPFLLHLSSTRRATRETPSTPDFALNSKKEKTEVFTHETKKQQEAGELKKEKKEKKTRETKKNIHSTPPAVQQAPRAQEQPEDGSRGERGLAHVTDLVDPGDLEERKERKGVKEKEKEEEEEF
jgi:hypothetical protein